jgi:threonine dehydrogenase-like Zn-dependent dehydrogenase
MFVTDICDANKEEEIEYRDKEARKSIEDVNGTENSDITIYNPVKCLICGTEVGMYDKKDEIYYFFDVIAADN